MRYCRFLWCGLMLVARELATGTSRYRLARIWSVSWGVIVRAAQYVRTLTAWTAAQYREVTDGAVASEPAAMVRRLIDTLDREEVAERWYCRRYPKRFRTPDAAQHNSSVLTQT